MSPMEPDFPPVAITAFITCRPATNFMDTSFEVAGRAEVRLRVRQEISYAFVALKLAWGEARGRECIRSDTRPTEQRSPRPISAQPFGRHVFWAEALLLAPHRSTSGYALVPVRKHLAPSLRPKSIAANV